MQLGIRWRCGESPHRSVPEALHPEIAAQEIAHPEAHSWTLTWLEGLPRCTLDELVRLSLNHEGEVVVTALGSSSGADAQPAGNGLSAGIGTDGADDADDDDDDWLK